MVKRVPFSITLITTIVVLSLITGSIFQQLPQSIEKTLAFNVQTFSIKSIFTVFTMILLSSNLLMVFGILVISVASFFYEFKFGTIKTFVLFWSTHFTGILSVLLLNFFRFQFVTTSDVGASIGFWGLAGAGLGYVKYKMLILAALIIFLLIYVLFRSWDLASIEHPAAFFSGMLYQKLIEKYEKSSK